MNKPNYIGPSFCPQCGFALTLIGMTIVMQRVKEGAGHEHELLPAPKAVPQIPAAPKPKREDIIARISELKTEGLGTTAISRKMGIPIASVYYYLNMAKAKRATAPRVKSTKAKGSTKPIITAEIGEKILSMRSSGMGATQIGRLLGIKPATVNSWMLRKTDKKEVAA